jgi:molybdate transport system substrate-binding protein
MTHAWRHFLRALVGLAVVSAANGPALAAEIRVMSGGAPQEALAVLVPRFESETGHKLTFTFAVISALQQKLAAGENTDMVLMPVPAIDKLVQDGKLKADGRGVLGGLGITVIVREGAPKPDIATPDAFRKTLLAARSVVHSSTATPSGVHLKRVIEELGIADAMKDKTTLRPALDGGAALVASGEAELGLYPTSEVIHVKGVTLVGPLPGKLQLNTVYGAAVAADNAAPEPALAFIRFLTDAANRKVWKGAGFDPPGG